MSEHQTDAQHETEVANAIDQKGLEVGVDRGWPVMPEANQQIRHQAHRLPAEKQLQEVIGHHQHQHREGEEADIGKKPLITVVILHVADGVDMHHQRDRGDNTHHRCGQRVDQETDLELHPINQRP